MLKKITFLLPFFLLALFQWANSYGLFNKSAPPKKNTVTIGLLIDPNGKTPAKWISEGQIPAAKKQIGYDK